MIDLLKQKAVEIWPVIAKAERILLHFHQSPDPDSVGSALATSLMLQALGKTVMVIKGDSPRPDFLERLPGRELVADKNLFEIDLADFDLFLILDTASIDRVSRVGEIVFPEHLKTVVIDHHASNPGFGQINLVDSSYPATAQILFDLFGEWQIEITPDMARLLFLGMYTDTGGFRFRGATADTLAAAAALAKIAPDFHQVLFDLMNHNNPKALRCEALMLNSIELFANDRVAIASIGHKTLTANGITEQHMHDGTANKLISVTGWEIGVAMREMIPGEVKASLRSRDQDRFDVSKIAAVLGLGGGGHKAAAGATIMADMPTAKKLLIEAIVKIYPELG